MNTQAPSFEDQLARVPLWRRLLLCWVIRRKQWRLAQAYNTVAVEEMNRGDWTFGDRVRLRGERQWAKLYGLRSPRPTLEPNHEMRAIAVEFELGIERDLRKQAEDKLHLMKNTARGLAAQRRQRPLPI